MLSIVSVSSVRLSHHVIDDELWLIDGRGLEGPRLCSTLPTIIPDVPISMGTLPKLHRREKVKSEISLNYHLHLWPDGRGDSHRSSPRSVMVYNEEVRGGSSLEPT